MIGPRGSRRIAWLQRALHDQGAPAAHVFDYETLLAEPARLLEALAQLPGAIVKLESPGEAPELHQALVRRGWELSGAAGDAPQAAAHGELVHQQFWYAGFADVLAALPSGPHYLNAPADLACMSDKLHCQQHLAAAGVAVPPLFGLISSYEDLRERLRDAGCERVFVKARYGSSGAGVLAYARNRDGREVAYGSAELVEQDGRWRVFNSLRQRRYDRHDDIARLVDLLAVQGAYIERWIPKPTVPGSDGRRYDVRVIALDGQPRQRVARMSAGALTNLHLGNARTGLDFLLDAEAIEHLETTTATAAAAFPNSRMIGFDLIVRGMRSWVLEANGFGDLLLDLRHAGRTTYEDQALLTPARPAINEYAHA
ncbi:STM4014 family protein [Stenotrophomonas terrae]|uniref:STM4014 family protein n=1 Tax=Stenotrophomonas terrae TaxID=405446 RepID=UPI003208F591